MAITAPSLALKGRLQARVLSGGGARCGARGRKDTVRTRAARASCLPAIRPAREVHRCDRTGGACGYVRSLMPPFGKPGPMLSPGDESPLGENRGGTPAGERARKRRAAQAAFLRGASRTPLACGHQTLRLPAFRFLFFFLFRSPDERSDIRVMIRR